MLWTFLILILLSFWNVLFSIEKYLRIYSRYPNFIFLFAKKRWIKINKLLIHFLHLWNVILSKRGRFNGRFFLGFGISLIKYYNTFGFHLPDSFSFNYHLYNPIIVNTHEWREREKRKRVWEIFFHFLSLTTTTFQMVSQQWKSTAWRLMGE